MLAWACLFCGFTSVLLRLKRRAAATAVTMLFVFSATVAIAGGPKYVAGTSYFNAGVTGQPVHWAAGQLNYYVDQGALNASITNQQAVAMVDAAAALWSAVPTAAVTLTDKGALNEDVSGSDVAVNAKGQFTAPGDVTPSASYPLAVIFDADGSVIDAVYGANASQPDSCQNNSVFTWMDSVNPDATAAHAIIVLNGRCATTANRVQMMSFELERAFGEVLGLDFSQVNQGVGSAGTQGWPVMQPISGACGPAGGACIPNPTQLRYDDIAALNRIYPVTASNLANFPGKKLTADNTISIRGTVSFRTGSGMQGVNVVARPLDANGNPLYDYTVTFVSGDYFSGNRGNPATGYTDANGVLYTQWGSEDATLQGYFDLSGIPLPPAVTAATYQVSFEAMNALYILENGVGPYDAGQVNPSGTLNAITLPSMTAGSTQTVNVTVADSAVGGYQDAIGSEAQPRPMPASGMWTGRLSQVAQTDWLTFPIRSGRMFTVVAQAVDETGKPTESKALPSIGVWDGFKPVGSAAAASVAGLYGMAAGETLLRINTSSDDIVRLGITDLRGDGRPDYAYNAWVLYADTVTPARIPASGGPIVIHGMGFRTADTVLVNGQQALVTSVSPNEITAIAPAAGTGVSGSVDVEVDDLPIYYAAAVIAGGVSYDAGAGDGLSLLTAPTNTVPMTTPLAFTVAATGSNGAPAGGVTVTYRIVSGIAQLGCGQSSCTVTSTGDGLATMMVTATNMSPAIVAASLANGSAIQAQFTGGSPALLTSLTPQLSLAAGAIWTWTVQALALNGTTPVAGQTITWQTATGITVQGTASASTNASGIATKTLTVGPLAEGQTAAIQACLNGTNQCVTYTAFGARPGSAVLKAVSGTSQSMAASSTPAAVVLRLLDMNGNAMAGGTVTLYQALYAWTPPCSAHTVCANGALLAAQSATATSALDGTVVFTPATMPGAATNVIGLAASGNTAAVAVAIEQHP